MEKILKGFDILGLSSIARAKGKDFLNNEYINSARRFVTSLTPERNGEDGADFWAWMLEHLVDNLVREMARRGGEKAGDGFCETLFLVNRENSEIVGTISAVRDDRGRGAKYNVPGIWLGGFNILPEFQQRGIGKELLSVLLEQIEFHQRFVAKKPVVVNLFTRNAGVGKMVEEIGFTENKGIVPDRDDRGRIFYFRIIDEK